MKQPLIIATLFALMSMTSQAQWLKDVEQDHAVGYGYAVGIPYELSYNTHTRAWKVAQIIVSCSQVSFTPPWSHPIHQSPWENPCTWEDHRLET